MKEAYNKFKNNWQAVLTKRYFVIEFIISIFVLIITMNLFSHFTQFVEMRIGIQFNDPILDKFKAINLTSFIFVMIYGGIILAIFSLL